MSYIETLSIPMLYNVPLERILKLGRTIESSFSSLDPASDSVTENPSTTQPSFTFTLPATGTASSPTSLPTPSTNPLLESLRKMQNSPGLPSFSGEWESRPQPF